MIKTFMLLLAFTITGPDGETRDETVHVLSRHFDTQTECKEFIHSWSGIIKDRGLSTVEMMLAEGWTVSLDEIGCRRNPAELKEAVITIAADSGEEEEE
tara:strand:+ start:16 stop:312 length:297 start_codon:yes stop_codon:yes gene_type:complete